MSKVIYLKPHYEEKDIAPIPYNRALDEDDYALWKAKQLHNTNITILKHNQINEYAEAWEDEE